MQAPFHRVFNVPAGAAGTTLCPIIDCKPPVIGVGLVNKLVQLNWLTNYTAYTLQTTTNLSSPWTAVSGAPLVQGNLNILTRTNVGTRFMTGEVMKA